jgi:hypothetical protein
VLMTPRISNIITMQPYTRLSCSNTTSIITKTTLTITPLLKLQQSPKQLYLSIAHAHPNVTH